MRVRLPSLVLPLGCALALVGLRAGAATNPDTLWVGFKSSSADVFRVGTGGTWSFEQTVPDSSQGWIFAPHAPDLDANIFTTPASRRWWYLDYGNTVNGVRGTSKRRDGVIGVWHVDDMSGVSSPILGARSAWCGLRVPGDAAAPVDAVTGNRYTGDLQYLDAGPGPGVRSGWPGYGDQWDQILYHDFPTTGAGIALSFDVRVRLDPSVSTPASITRPARWRRPPARRPRPATCSTPRSEALRSIPTISGMTSRTWGSTRARG